MIPVMTAALVLSVSGSVAQGGFVFAGESLVPKASRLSPAAKLKQMFSIAGLSGMLKSLIPFGAILYVGMQSLQSHWHGMAQASALSLRSLASLIFAILVEVSWKSGLILLIWSAADYAMTWHKQESDLRMSKEELRQEYKETDGNPAIKARIRKIQRQMRHSQTLQAAATATVVITNPTHFAVALRYELDMEAPLVVAKGRDLIAQKIKEIAYSNGIPVMENKPLAQALYKVVEVGQAIPSKLYAAVAEILVVVYRAQAELRKQEEWRRSKNASGEVM
jgi:flagellar biosynthetic protein FlhB